MMMNYLLSWTWSLISGCYDSETCSWFLVFLVSELLEMIDSDSGDCFVIFCCLFFHCYQQLASVCKKNNCFNATKTDF